MDQYTADVHSVLTEPCSASAFSRASLLASFWDGRKGQAGGRKGPPEKAFSIIKSPLNAVLSFYDGRVFFSSENYMYM